MDERYPTSIQVAGTEAINSMQLAPFPDGSVRYHVYAFYAHQENQQPRRIQNNG